MNWTTILQDASIPESIGRDQAVADAIARSKAKAAAKRKAPKEGKR